MSYRTLTIDWLPSSAREWHIFTAARQEAACVWNCCVIKHAEIREQHLPWPTKGELCKEMKGGFPELHSQSVQQTIGDFCEAIQSVTALRKNGHLEARYPFRQPNYRCVIFTNQGARIRDGVLILPCGIAGKLRVKIPSTVSLPGRLMEVRLHYGRVEVVCKVPDQVRPEGPVIGVDLGVNTLLAATDGQKAVLISGREVKATVQLRNKRLASLNSKQAGKIKGSRRWKKIQRRKYRILDRAKRKVRDLCHKATRKVADAFPNAKAYVGEPFNAAAQKVGRQQAQQVSQACTARLISMLGYKLASATTVDESYTSRTCPVCGVRNRCRRTYRCSCGLVAPRDVVGGTNILSVGLHGRMVPGRSVPNAVQYVYPTSIPVKTG